MHQSPFGGGAPARHTPPGDVPATGDPDLGPTPVGPSRSGPAIPCLVEELRKCMNLP
jgi:hypothetical protein